MSLTDSNFVLVINQDAIAKRKGMEQDCMKLFLCLLLGWGFQNHDKRRARGSET
jgi:hypothetical protein